MYQSCFLPHTYGEYTEITRAVVTVVKARCKYCGPGWRIRYTYGLDGAGIESRWGGARFSASVQTGPGVHPAFLYSGYRVSFLGVKRPGRGIDHPLPSSAKVEERV